MEYLNNKVTAMCDQLRCTKSLCHDSLAMSQILSAVVGKSPSVTELFVSFALFYVLFRQIGSARWGGLCCSASFPDSFGSFRNERFFSQHRQPFALRP